MPLVNRVAGMAAVLGGILLAVMGWRLDPGTSRLPGPGFFPLLIAFSMAGLGIWLLLHPGLEEKRIAARSSRWKPFMIALVSIMGYAGALTSMGYLLSTLVLLLVQLRWVEKQGWRSSLLIAALAAGVSLVLFRVLLRVPLPLGILPLPKGW